MTKRRQRGVADDVHFWWNRRREVEVALAMLHRAADRLSSAGAGQANRAVRRAMKSVDGARRHAEGMQSAAITVAEREGRMR
jgi:hypothetical protein